MANDLTGQRFGRLVAIRYTRNNHNDKRLWLCRCDCGNEVEVISSHLSTGKTNSCGCLRKDRSSEIHTKDLSGQKIGRLSIIEKYGHASDGVILWKCRCDCGNICTVRADSLNHQTTLSCGCLKREMDKDRLKTHGLSNMKLYHVWLSMKDRCLNPRNKSYFYYGGRGIAVCEEWLESFLPFYEWSINHGYKEGLTIDRINNDGNYEPDNCRWTTWDVQSKNRRKHEKSKD